MIKFQYFSDLHLERYLSIPKIEQVADNLILAGDIGHPNTEIYNEFFYSCSKKYKKIYVVLGNHEINWMNKNKIKFKDFPEKNIQLLNNDYVITEEKILLAGSILWTSEVNKNENMKSINFFKNIITNEENLPTKKIFISHYLPSFQLIVKKYQNYTTKNRYANNLEYLMNHSPNGSPQIWICGHSHSVVKKQIHHTMCHINTFGQKYPSIIKI